MWTIFALENLFFAVNVFCALVLFAVAWLYSDAYTALRNKRDIWKIFGFIVLGLSFLLRGLDLRNIIIFQNIDIYLRILGYGLLFFGLLIDPLQPRPKEEKVSAFVLLSLPPLYFLSPVLAALVGILYLRRASIGLERHIYPPAICFMLLSIYELLFSLNIFRNSTNLNIFNLLAPFGIIWTLDLAILTIAIFWLARWVFRYLLKQFESQLFMVLMGLVLSIYLIVTVGFTGLLINNLKNQILNELTSQAKVMDFAFNSKRAELMSEAKLIAKSDLKNPTTGHDSLIVFDKDGLVTYRAEDTERKGDSISADKLVKQILDGKENSNVVVHEGVVAPTIMIVSGAPVLSEGKVTGGVIVGDLIDDAYLEGFSKLTGLSVAVYGDSTLSAGGTLGTRETNSIVKEIVLTKGETYSLESRWLNRQYLSVYAPLKDVEGNPVGMFFVGRPQAEVIKIASNTLEIVFIGTVILLILSMVPAKLIAISISKQIK